jgi:hypothetical protein
LSFQTPDTVANLSDLDLLPTLTSPLMSPQYRRTQDELTRPLDDLILESLSPQPEENNNLHQPYSIMSRKIKKNIFVSVFIGNYILFTLLLYHIICQKIKEQGVKLEY